jgi:hypothetical protein
MCQKVQAGLN